MPEGKIKWYNEKKGYGFISTENGDIFFHKTGIKEYGFFGLEKDENVEFELKETARGTQAVNIRVLKHT